MGRGGVADGEKCSVLSIICSNIPPLSTCVVHLYIRCTYKLSTYSILSHRSYGRLKNETKEKVCLFNRTPKHDSALISVTYMTSIATRGPPTPQPPFTSSTFILNVIYFCDPKQRAYYFTYLRKVIERT